MKTQRLILCGLGNVGRSFLHIMQTQADLLRERYDLELKLVAAADSAGAILDAHDISTKLLLNHKLRKQSVSNLPGGIANVYGTELAARVEADILLEATPVNLRDAQPALDTCLTALRRGMSVVLANKAPLALAYQQLAELSDMGQASPERGHPHDWPALRFSACVGGSMPTINIGRRDLAGARVERVEAVLNGTTQGILRAMENGVAYADALAEMQRRGLAETDPSLDVEGWDAANKLTIIANAVLLQPSTVHDVQVQGITELTLDDLRAAQERHERVVLLCLAQKDESNSARFVLSVRPTALPQYHPLARMTDDEMGVVYYTDITGAQTATTMERDPIPTAAAMLRDVIDISLRKGSS